jgi:hypothetical protein
MRRLLAFAALLASAAAISLPSSGLAEVAQSGNLRIGLDAKLAPRELPRKGKAPVSVTLDGKIKPLRGELPPRLATIQIAINREGRLDTGAVPTCAVRRIQPSTTVDARRFCGSSLVGEGRFSAEILLPEQTPFPSVGRVLAFNGSYRGKPAVLAHVYGTEPAPTSFTLPFLIGRGSGRFGVTLTAAMPDVAATSAYVTGLRMTLGGGAGTSARPYLSAGCPAPPDLGSVLFPLVRAGFAFEGAPTLRSTMLRTCEVRR